MNLALGTAQFGMNYGISNQSGRTSLREINYILQYAGDNGIETLDTASLYGDSESVLGKALPKTHNFRIITKTPVFKKKKISLNDAEELKRSLINSLERLGQNKVAGLLVHYADDLLVDGGELLFQAMQQLRTEGLVGKIGVSVYTGQQIECLIEKYEFEFFQVPMSVLDQRLIEGGQLTKLKEKGLEVHVRSVFLQGLLLMDPSLIHSFFDPIKPLLYRYRKLLDSMELNPVDGALGFVKSIPGIDYVVIGVNNLKQLKDNIDSVNKTYKVSLCNGFKEFSMQNDKYLNPALWQLN